MKIIYPKHTYKEINDITKLAIKKITQIEMSPKYFVESAFWMLMNLLKLFVCGFILWFGLKRVFKWIFEYSIKLNTPNQNTPPMLLELIISICIFLIFLSIVLFAIGFAFRSLEKTTFKSKLTIELKDFNEIYNELSSYTNTLQSIERIKNLPQIDLLESDFYIEEDGFTTFFKSNGFIERHVFKCDREKMKDICTPNLIDFSSIDTQIDEILNKHKNQIDEISKIQYICEENK